MLNILMVTLIFLESNNYTIFEMEQIAEAKNAITPALNYLFIKQKQT